MRSKVFTVPVALLVLFCAACNNSAMRKEKLADRIPTTEAKATSVDGVASADSSITVTDKEDFQEPDKPGANKQQGKPPAATPAPNPDWDRKIVKTADLNIEVKNFRQYSNRLRSAVRQSGAYIAQEQQNESLSEIENSVTVKVPVDRFDDLLLQMPSDSDKMIQKKVASEDVTMELVDTKSRLETKKEVRERYLDLLKQAHSMKDIITVQNEINDIQGEMDQASGRIAWLGHSAAYSTINLHFYQVLDAGIREDPSPSFVHKLMDSISEGWKGFSALLLELISVWPLWIVLAFGITWARRVHKRVRIKAAVGIK